MATVNPVSFAALRAKPHDCCLLMKRTGAVSYFDIATAAHTAGVTIFDVEFLAPEQLPDYPNERARISVLADSSIAAVPIGDPDRTWHHRYPRWSIPQITQCAGGLLPWLSVVGGLCLWYPSDPRARRWAWDDGFDAYVLLVQRHLWAEEFYRRHSHWPAEDAPHGERPDGKPHSLLRSA